MKKLTESEKKKRQFVKYFEVNVANTVRIMQDKKIKISYCTAKKYYKDPVIRAKINAKLGPMTKSEYVNKLTEFARDTEFYSELASMGDRLAKLEGWNEERGDQLTLKGNKETPFYVEQVDLEDRIKQLKESNDNL